MTHPAYRHTSPHARSSTARKRSCSWEGLYTSAQVFLLVDPNAHLPLHIGINPGLQSMTVAGLLQDRNLLSGRYARTDTAGKPSGRNPYACVEVKQTAQHHAVIPTMVVTDRNQRHTMAQCSNQRRCGWYHPVPLHDKNKATRVL